MKKSIVLMACAFLTSVSSFAQKSEFSIGFKGGFSSLDYKLNNPQLEDHRSNGGALELKYNYYISPSFSVGIGAEGQYYHASITADQLSGSYNAVDNEGDAFVLNYNASRYKDKQDAYFVGIPITFQYETKGDTRLYASVGAKVSFAIKSDSKTSIDEITTNGYYPAYNVTLYEPWFMGFGTNDKVETSREDFDLKTAFSAIAELGVKRALKNGDYIYLGAYLDYGLNNILDSKSDKQNVTYNTNNPSAYTYNSLINSSFIDAEGNSKAFVDEIKLISFGVKLKYAFTFGKKGTTTTETSSSQD